VKLADDQQGQTFNAVDPNLKPFMARGGKLVVYHGWSDAALPPMGAVNYYNSVEATLGAPATASFMRLYMVPGMQHCQAAREPTSSANLGPQATHSTISTVH
jgi:feruloyl esterase